MLFTKHTILLMRQGSCRTCQFTLRPWIFIVVATAFVLLSLNAYHLWKNCLGTGGQSDELTELKKVEEDQRAELIRLSGKARALEKEVGRIREFDGRLAVMFGQAPRPGQGGAGIHELGRRSLTPFDDESMSRTMTRFLDELHTEVRLEEVRQQELLINIRSQLSELHLLPSIWPVKGPVTSPFGYRRHPVTGQSDFHQAIDISAPKGTPVHASAGGRVIFADWDGAYGYCVHVRHNNKFVTRYAHLSKIRVRLAQKVERGDIVGEVGATGRATGAHLHYEVRIYNKPENPRNYILD